MSIPPAIDDLIRRINQELDQTEQVATEARELVERRRSLFPENEILILLLAEADLILNSVNYHRERAREIAREIEKESLPEDSLREAVEDLGELLGRVIEGKMRAIRLKSRME